MVYKFRTISLWSLLVIAFFLIFFCLCSSLNTEFCQVICVVSSSQRFAILQALHKEHHILLNCNSPRFSEDWNFGGKHQRWLGWCWVWSIARWWALLPWGFHAIGLMEMLMPPAGTRQALSFWCNWTYSTNSLWTLTWIKIWHSWS